MHFADAVWSSKAFANSGVLKCVCPVERVKSSTLELILWFQHCVASDRVTARSLRDFERERESERESWFVLLSAVEVQWARVDHVLC